MSRIIVARAEWGARHPGGFRPAPLPAARVWLHHSVTPPGPGTLIGDVAAVRTLERIGQERFGGGISYTYAVTRSGRVFEGHGVDREGAHTRGQNATARAICLVGNFEDDRPPEAMIDAVAWLLREGASRMWWTRAELAGGHRDAAGAATACPGRHAYTLIPVINSRASRPTAPPPPPRPPAPTGPGRGSLREGDTGDEIADLQEWLNRMYPSYSRIDLEPRRYGPQTRAVIAEFQRRTGVTGSDADGTIVGPRTWAALAAEGYR